MYISVIPLRHSLSKRPYTYFVADVWKDAIVIGGLVEVPIGKHMTEAIVAQILVHPEEHISIEDIRAIIRVTASIEIIAPYMISMILGIADKYFLMIHKVASMFLPAPLLSRLDKRNYILQKPLDKQKSGRNWEIHHYIDSIFDANDLKKYMMPGNVFIFPDDILLRFFEEAILPINKENTGVFPTNLTSARRVRSWIESYEQKYNIIFGTRRILYYNLNAYKHIIYIEDAFATEQYTYPIRIQNLDILKSLQESGNHDITIITSTPTLLTLSYFHSFRIIAKRKKVSGNAP